MDNDVKYMKIALKEAQKAKKIDEVPVGAVVVKDGEIIAKAHNLREKKQMATAHAEVLAIEKACKKIGSWRLENCTLYVTLEPCPMCAGSILLSRVERVVYGASDPKGGAIEHTIRLFDYSKFNHYPSIEYGILEDECGQILKDFFKEKREKKKREKNQTLQQSE